MGKMISNRLKQGDIIFALRYAGTYLHYEVYVGNKKVIHFATEDFDDNTWAHAKIIQTSIEDFAHGADVYIEQERKGAKRDIDTVVYAKAHLGSGLKSYNPVTNNCEHFANMCKYGEKKSYQISRILSHFGLPIITKLPIIPIIPMIPITLVEHYVYNNIIKQEGCQKVFISD